MRHSWVKLREHHYICQKCGCGCVNFQDHREQWASKYCLPTGEAKVLRHTPACEVGPKTQKYLDHYAVQIADAAAVRASAKAAKKATKAPVGAEAHP